MPEGNDSQAVDTVSITESPENVSSLDRFFNASEAAETVKPEKPVLPASTEAISLQPAENISTPVILRPEEVMPSGLGNARGSIQNVQRIQPAFAGNHSSNHNGTLVGMSGSSLRNSSISQVIGIFLLVATIIVAVLFIVVLFFVAYIAIRAHYLNTDMVTVLEAMPFVAFFLP